VSDVSKKVLARNLVLEARFITSAFYIMKGKGIGKDGKPHPFKNDYLKHPFEQILIILNGNTLEYI
jgi:hypothetical protein